MLSRNRPHLRFAFALISSLLALGLSTRPSNTQTLRTPAKDNASAKLVRQFLVERSAQKKKQVDEDFARLQGFSDKYVPAILDAEKKIGFDQQTFNASLRALAAERDLAVQRKLAAQFRTKYEPQMRQMAQMADIDLVNVRRQIMQELNLRPGRQQADDSFALQTSDEPRSESAPSSSGREGEQFFRAPFTAAGTASTGARANQESGALTIDTEVNVVGSHQTLSFITQDLNVAPGVNRVRVFANFGNVQYSLHAFALAGYASSEAIVNLHVLEGSREICSGGDRLSLSRIYAPLLWISDDEGNRPIQLRCEINRPNPREATTYTMTAVLETWTGGAGLPIQSSARMQSSIQEFHVYRE